jgi:hypothetical protein
MRVRARWAFLLCLLFCQAGGGIAWASIEDIWGTPLLVRELAAKLPCILFDEIPIQNWDTPVRWCEEAWCVTPVESTNLFWAGAPLCLLVGSVMEALLGPITYSIGRAVASEVPLEDELQDELPHRRGHRSGIHIDRTPRIHISGHGGCGRPGKGRGACELTEPLHNRCR